MEIDLSYQPIELECPQCGYHLDLLLKQVMAEEIVLCPGCLCDIQLIDESGSTQRAQREINEALNNLKKANSKNREVGMVAEIKDVRVKWQNYRQMLMKADYNHADEQLAQAMYYANKNPLISGILNRIRSSTRYQEFISEEWFSKRRDANVLGAGRTSLGFSLDEEERMAQHLKVLEMIIQKGEGGLYSLGTKTYGGSGTKLIDYVHSAVEVIFDPFYHYIDFELRSMESLITPTDIMNEVVSLVDNTVSTQYPLTHKLLTDTYQQLFTLAANSTGASWNQVGYACRHVLITFADEVFDPSYVPEGLEQPKGDNARDKLKWTVRSFIKQVGAGDQYRDAIEKKSCKQIGII